MSSIRRALMWTGLALLPPAAARAAPLGRPALPRWALLSLSSGPRLPSPSPPHTPGRFPARWASATAAAGAAAPDAAQPADPVPAAPTEPQGPEMKEKEPEPLILEDDAHPLRDGAISRPCWTVLARLRAAGHEVFLVGGTVRDILLGARPKDFDVLTSADPEQAAALFARAYVLGRSFPIVHVHHEGEIIEVSSFSTGADPSTLPLDAAAAARGRDHRREARRAARRAERDRGGRGGKKGRQEGRGGGDDAAALATLADSLFPGGAGAAGTSSLSEDGGSGSGSGGEGWGVAPAPVGPTWAAARRDNARKRDFTVNGLLYDPFGRILYDYVGGVADCGARLLRSLGPPPDSLAADPARILRAVRLAARAGLAIDAPTAAAMARLAPLTAALPQGRLQMELAAVMAHGAAAPSVRLLWRFGLLDVAVPLLAALLAAERVPREPAGAGAGAAGTGAPGAVLLFELLRAMDAQGGVGRPVDSAVWVTALAAPLVAAECRRTAARRRARRRRAAAGAEGDADAASGADDSLDIPLASEGGQGDQGEQGQLESGGGGGGGRSELQEEESSDGAATPEYLEAYSKVVDKVLGRLLAPPDAKTRRALAGAPRPPLAAGAEEEGEEGLPAGSPPPTVACLLPRQAVESARELFLLEAELRGAALPAPEEAAPKRAARRAAAAHTARHLRRRRLTPAEHLALRLLRAPGAGWAVATAL